MELTKTQLLYGIDVNTNAWLAMSYPEVLRLKARLAYERIKTLNQTHYLKKDSNNITDCVNAIKFNEALLKEMK